MAGIPPRLRKGLETISNRFLAGLIVMTILMLGLSVACGPDPRVKVYLFAEEETVTSLSKLMCSEVEDELVFYTPRDELNDLDVLVKTKTVRMILIADHPLTPSTETIFGILETALVGAEHVFVLESFEEHEFASQMIDSIPEKVEIASWRKVCQEINRMKRESYWSYSSYEMFLKCLALFSLVIVGAGAASCSSRIIKSGSNSPQKGIGEGAVFAGVVFLLIQWVYFTSSVIVETPISLHTTYARITAISLLGPFGGGTVPRILSSVIGMLLGIFLTSRKTGHKISILVLPLTAFGLVLLLTVGIAMFGVAGNLPARLFSRYGYLFYGSLVRTGRATYLEVRFSRGVMMLFAGFLPLGAITRMKGWLRGLTVSFSVIAGSWGLMRVGDMRFYVALRSFLPGVVLGVILSLALLLISRMSGLLATSFQDLKSRTS